LLLNAVGEQRNTNSKVLAENRTESEILMSATPLGLSSGPVTTWRQMAGQTTGKAMGVRVKPQCDPWELNRSKIRWLVDQRGADLAV
jgi:hypothetical protein